ncbi:RecQ-mediated genome instability protein 1 [Bienertia sinuspersici]
MSRRRLLTVYSSSDEDVPQQPQFENPNPNPNPNIEQLQQQQQNDDQDVFFDDAMALEEDDIETPSPISIPNIDSVTLNSSHTTNTATASTTTTATTAVSEQPSIEISDEEFVDVSDNMSPQQVVTASFVASDCPVNDHLRKLGLNLRREWLDSCKLGLQNSVAGFSNFDAETKAKLCFGEFLYSDMNYTGAGVLPQNVHALHLVDLAGPYVLQVDEVINISCPLRERYKNAPAGVKRCLKLSMTDGVQRVFGMEYRPIKSLEALAPAGFKVVIQNVNVRRGLLMLVPEVIETLGGSVEELEAARQRLVHEVNKPPKGKRTRNGIVPPLSTRATLAAWAQNGVSNTGTPNDATRAVGNTSNSVAHAAPQVQESTSINRSRLAPHSGIVITELPTCGRADQHSLSRESGQINSSRETAQIHSSVGARVLPMNGEVAEPPSGRESAVHIRRQETAQSSTRADAHDFPTSNEAPARERTEPNPLSNTVIENEDAHMLDYTEHPFILSGEKELPFTYLASLSTKWVAVQGNEPFVRGKIKCFLTGVKKFQFKGRSTFELRVYVDDGSLISEILVHHNVVQKAIGYSPKEVTAALSSDEVVAGNMKNTGTMLVEMNEGSTIPVALEMNQGCLTSDAWLLLQRLKPDTSRPLCQSGQPDVITLSP